MTATDTGADPLISSSVSPAVAKLDKAEDEKIAADLAALRSFVADVHATEKAGQRFTAEEADILGAEAQNRATAVTGQISQVAARLNVKIAE